MSRDFWQNFAYSKVVRGDTLSLLGTNIRKHREDRGLTQFQLGEQIGLAESTISLYESGKREPNLDTVQLFADFFGCSVDQLLGRNNSPNPKPNPLTLEAEPSRQDLEEFLRTSNVQFNGAPLDETDKEEIIDVLKYVWERLRKDKNTFKEN